MFACSGACACAVVVTVAVVTVVAVAAFCKSTTLLVCFVLVLCVTPLITRFRRSHVRALSLCWPLESHHKATSFSRLMRLPMVLTFLAISGVSLISPFCLRHILDAIQYWSVDSSRSTLRPFSFPDDLLYYINAVESIVIMRTRPIIFGLVLGELVGSLSKVGQLWYSEILQGRPLNPTNCWQSVWSVQ